MSVTVIAEPGCTHEGQFLSMSQLVQAAIDAGCDAIKPQWVSSPAKLCERRKADGYRKYYEWLSYPINWHVPLSIHAHNSGLQYGCSMYLPGDAATLAPYVDFLKISSFEASDLEIIWAAIATGKRLIVSTGMADLAEVKRIQETLETARADYRLLHCTSSYPAPVDEMELSVLDTTGIGGWLFDGLSDHSARVEMGGWAVMKGASVIEAHLTLGEANPKNPDVAHAFTPGQLAEYVRQIRDADRALGIGLKMRQPSESAMAQFKVA